VRHARAIPYTLHADGLAGATSFSINFQSSGGAAAVFHVRSADAAQDPRSYTVESGKQLAESWDFTSGYDLSVHGPNGFFRRFKGSAGGRGRVSLSRPGTAHGATTTRSRCSSRTAVRRWFT
jgi:phospholipase C